MWLYTVMKNARVTYNKNLLQLDFARNIYIHLEH